MSTSEAANQDELAKLDDVQFLSHCRTVRRVAERTPVDELSAEAKTRLEQVNAEFLRRAGMAWRDAS